ncbi:MAG: hypothetical protein ACO1OT_07590 [Heyndrickxia sp.]
MMKISNVQVQQAQNQAISNNSSLEGSPAEEARESATEKAHEAQQKAIAQSTGVGTKVDVIA